eukprot:gene17083-biopygen5097
MFILLGAKEAPGYYRGAVGHSISGVDFCRFGSPSVHFGGAAPQRHLAKRRLAAGRARLTGAPHSAAALFGTGPAGGGGSEAMHSCEERSRHGRLSCVAGVRNPPCQAAQFSNALPVPAPRHQKRRPPALCPCRQGGAQRVCCAGAPTGCAARDGSLCRRRPPRRGDPNRCNWGNCTRRYNRVLVILGTRPGDSVDGDHARAIQRRRRCRTPGTYIALIGGLHAVGEVCAMYAPAAAAQVGPVQLLGPVQPAQPPRSLASLELPQVIWVFNSMGDVWGSPRLGTRKCDKYKKSWVARLAKQQGKERQAVFCPFGIVRHCVTYVSTASDTF